MITEKLLFAVHEGTVGHNRAGIIMQDHCLPLACSHRSYPGHGGAASEAGIYACWEATGDVEEFFSALGIGPGIENGPGEANRYIPPPNGLYVYTVEYDPDADEWQEIMMSDNRADEWPWLEGGTLRRPTAEELEPLTRGEAPWGGVVL